SSCSYSPTAACARCRPASIRKRLNCSPTSRTARWCRPMNDGTRPRICPWGTLAFILGVLGLLLASSVGIRLVTVALSSLGLLVAAIGLPASKARRPRDRLWLGLGGLVSGLVLGAALFFPGLVNDFWAM